MNLPPLRKAWPDKAKEDFEERAAIMELDGGLTRAEAERLAETRIRETFNSPRPVTGEGPGVRVP